MKFTLDPFALVIKAEEKYNFFLCNNIAEQITPSEKQIQVLDSMSKGEFYTYEELCDFFGKAFVDKLISSGSFVSENIDISSIFSRTNAFFKTHDMPDARKRLSKQKVLILGCGGIGTHMAWHMATLGVSKITLVDFDTVEVSNLNRQLLFDVNDAGKKKVEVLKSKLEAINTDIIIEAVTTKISSENELESICLCDDYDLIIKALDSPVEFPIWLDNISKKHDLTYIAGITMRDTALIGPSFIPNKSMYGWSDLTDIGKNKAEKVYGTAPSLGIMLYHISDELAVEAFKIMTGYGKPKFTDKILARNLITDEEHIIQKDNASIDAPYKQAEHTDGKLVVLNVLLVITLAVAGMRINWFIPIALFAAVALPLFICRTSLNVTRCAFINAAVLSLVSMVHYLSVVVVSSVSNLIYSAIVLFWLYSALTLAICIISCLGHKFLHKLVS